MNYLLITALLVGLWLTIKIITYALNNVLSSGREKLVNGKRQIEEGWEKYRHGQAQYSAGAYRLNRAKNWQSTPFVGFFVNVFAGGKIANGERQLAEGAVQLTEGYNKLRDGEKQYADGLVRFRMGNFLYRFFRLCRFVAFWPAFFFVNVSTYQLFEAYQFQEGVEVYDRIYASVSPYTNLALEYVNQYIFI